jgi:arginyl-tRNA synthetase
LLLSLLLWADLPFMTYLEKVKHLLAESLSCQVTDFVYPPETKLGHLSWPLFSEAAKRKEAAPLLAIKLAAELNNSKKLPAAIKEVRSVGPYLNFFLNPDIFVLEVGAEIIKAGDRFGSQSKKSEAAVMIEYSNGNTHKELHVGHLRNISYGDAVTKILAASGERVIPVSYINDFGIHTAKTIWNWQRQKKYHLALEPKGYLLGRCYAESVKLIGEDEQAKKEVSEIMKLIEGRQGEVYELWQETRQWSIDYFNSVYEILNIRFKDTFYESDFIDRGLKIKEELLDRGILKNSEGAVIADLESENLGVLPIIRSDGTALYAVADLALASAKFSKYDLSESIYVVDVRQSLYFQQLFAVLRRMGYQEKMTHLSYDFLTLKSGMMSSRTGNVITFQEVLDEAEIRARQEIEKRHDKWSEDKIFKTARALAVSALKFEMIKIAADKVITFDIAESLRFDGYTAAYLQYTGARASSLLAKGNNFLNSVQAPNYEEPELVFALKLERYSEALDKAATDRDPSVIARYLFELAQAFNDYYQQRPILKSPPQVASGRLRLVHSFSQVLKNGFDLLGLIYLEEM